MSNLKVKIIQSNNTYDNSFKIGQKIKHKEENIYGTVRFIGKNHIAVAWDDNTRERFNFNDIHEHLSYVDSIQTLVAPLTPQIS